MPVKCLPALTLALLAGMAVCGPAAAQSETEGFTDAAKAPLRDLNMIRADIPLVLLEATEAPYALPRPLTCAQLITEVARLDEALGPDLDAPEAAEPGLLTRGHGAAVSVVRSAAQGVLPFRSWIRKLSGAERFDRTVQAAIDAGGVRRAFLKGIGVMRSCGEPAAPTMEAQHSLAEPPQKKRRGPRFPIR
jgi:hypothetical protein